LLRATPLSQIREFWGGSTANGTSQDKVPPGRMAMTRSDLIAGCLGSSVLPLLSEGVQRVRRASAPQGPADRAGRGFRRGTTGAILAPRAMNRGRVEPAGRVAWKLGVFDADGTNRSDSGDSYGLPNVRRQGPTSQGGR